MTKPKLTLERVELNSGVYIRPLNSCGNIGWHPFPWTMLPERKFLEAHAEFLKDYEVTVCP